MPAVFFINAAFLDNERLAPDNLVCYVVHVHGLSLVNTAIRQVLGDRAAEVNSLAEIFDVLFPSLSLLSRQDFLETLLKLADIDERSMAREASLYRQPNNFAACSRTTLRLATTPTLTCTADRSLPKMSSQRSI